MLTAIRRMLSREEGMSLVEVLIVMVLMGIIIPPALMFISSTQRTEREVADATQQQQDARTALESLSRHLREAGYPEGLNSSQAAIFASASPNTMSFFTDFDTDSVNERVTYSLDTTSAEISRTILEPDCSVAPCAYTGTGTTAVTMQNVRNGDLAPCGDAPGTSTPVFRYYKGDPGAGTLTEIPAAPTVDALVDISYVSVTLVSDVRPEDTPVCQRLETAVSLRNWRG